MPSSFVPFSSLLSRGREARVPVAFGLRGARDFGAFEADVAALHARIEEHGRGRWLLFTEDSYAAAVALLALAHARSLAVLPPNAQAGTISRLASDAVGALFDRDVAGAAHPELPCLDPLRQPAVRGRSWQPLDPSLPIAEFFTSGTTGESKPVTKALRHLDDEVAYFEGRFGAELSSECGIFATASHQHLYGLLFRVLWPLAAGRPFCSDTFLHLEELLPRMRRFGGPCLLAATPVHLKRLAALEEFAALRGRCRGLFSSGGVLERETALAIQASLGRAPCEILGSTETGGVAWRQRSASPRDADEAELWTPLSPVSVEIDRETGEDRLAVSSPFVSVGAAGGPGTLQRFVMGDRARMQADSRFALLGRADRVVKIGEKRLSLPEMESRLRAHPHVAEAALVTLEKGAEARVHAVVVPSESGWTTLERAGRRALGAELTRHLAPDWERVLLPRAWRYVEDLPRDAQGKAPVAALRGLFRNPAAPEDAEPVRDPIVPAEHRGELVFERRLRVPAELVHLKGHFPGFPVVAGVVQLRWVFHAARDWLGEEPKPAAIEALKFSSLLRPGQSLLLRLELDPARERLRFELADGATTFSSGRLVQQSGTLMKRFMMKRFINVPDCCTRPCLLIPIFDHGETIRGVVESLAGHGLACLIVDDGSGVRTRRELEALAQDHPWVEVIRRPSNGGRGEALKCGYRVAAARGYTHAIQLDADAQHDAADVPRFVDAIRSQPDALVLGAPIFDETVPRSRLYGRQISRVLVWCFTLSFEVNDPLCGFRGIPLDSTLRLLDRVSTGGHMEFDPELVVRLCWEDVPIVNVATKVVYDPGGLSHFDVVWDDLRLSGVYTRFMLAMALRVPQILWRRLRRREAARSLEAGADK